MDTTQKKLSHNFDPYLVQLFWGVDVQTLLLHIYRMGYTNQTEIKTQFKIGTHTLQKLKSKDPYVKSLTCIRFLFIFAYYINRHQNELASIHLSASSLKIEQDNMRVTKRLFKGIYADLADFTLFAASKIDLSFVYTLEKDNVKNRAELNRIYHDIEQEYYIKTARRYHLRFSETTNSAGKEPEGQDEAPPKE